jgi:NTP pyrophosphatase (non-canonical NTP hydrolase)
VALEKGWYEVPRGVPELLCLIHSEVSEALEAYRHAGDNITDIFENIGEELADIIIRVADMAEYFKIDLDHHVVRKYNLNMRRPYRHGGKRA